MYVRVRVRVRVWLAWHSITGQVGADIVAEGHISEWDREQCAVGGRPRC